MWVRHCQTLLDNDGKPVDARRMPAEEVVDAVIYCGRIDGARAYPDAELPDPGGWRCPACGGTEYEWVQAADVFGDAVENPVET